MVAALSPVMPTAPALAVAVLAVSFRSASKSRAHQFSLRFCRGQLSGHQPSLPSPSPNQAVSPRSGECECGPVVLHANPPFCEISPLAR